MAVNFKKNKIFVEGQADQVFLRDLLFLIFGIKLSNEKLKDCVVPCNSYNNLNKHKDLFDEIKEGGKREGGKNLLIFDSDFQGRDTNHGFKNKSSFLENCKLDYDIDFDMFLFPNDKDDGTLETLLETCINPENIEILYCWQELESCIKRKGNFTKPADKSKVYFYLECLYGDSNSEKDKIKDSKRNFLEADKWFFDFSKNKNLFNLKSFLLKILV